MTRRILIAAAAAACLTGASLAQGAETSKDIHKTLPLDAHGRVSIDTYKGLIRVTTWDQPQVDVQVRIEADGWSGRSDREMVQATDIEFDASANSIRMKTRYPKRESWFDSSWSMPLARYTIRMPRTAELRIKDYKSDIDVDGLSAALEIDTYKGEVQVRRQAGALNVKTYKSDARVSFASYNNRSSFETYKGVYDISLPRDARFEVVSEAGRRASVDTSFALMMPAGSRRERNSFRATVNGGGPSMYLKGYRGEFRIR